MYIFHLTNRTIVTRAHLPNPLTTWKGNITLTLKAFDRMRKRTMEERGRTIQYIGKRTHQMPLSAQWSRNLLQTGAQRPSIVQRGEDQYCWCYRFPCHDSTLVVWECWTLSIKTRKAINLQKIEIYKRGDRERESQQYTNWLTQQRINIG